MAKMTKSRDELSLEMGRSVVQLARWLIDRRDTPETTDDYPRLTGYRMRTKDGRIISSTRAMERVISSKECIDLLRSGVELDDLVPWLNHQILDDLSAAAEASFLNVDGLATATQVHEWVDAQQHKGAC